VPRPRLLLADNHTLVAAGFKKLLEPRFNVVATVEDGLSLVRRALELRPDAVLADIAMPLLSGIEAARRIRKAAPQVKIIFVTIYRDPDYVEEALRAGASGYVLKQSPVPELAAAIREVLRGGTYVTSLLFRPGKGAASERLKSGKTSSALTPRQRQVLRLVAEGNSTKEIAAILNVSVKTVEFHKAAIVQKLELHGIAELTRYAIEHGIVI
jgi:DNA-binding NarL/FixJ family response regulator